MTATDKIAESLGAGAGAMFGFVRAAVVEAAPAGTVTLSTVVFGFAGFAALWLVRMIVESRDNTRRLLIFAYGQPEEGGKGGVQRTLDDHGGRIGLVEHRTDFAIRTLDAHGQRLRALGADEVEPDPTGGVTG